MASLATAFGLGRGCFGREGVLRGTGTFPETGGDDWYKSIERLIGQTDWPSEKLYTNVNDC
ncbi:hypothetical protein FB106_1155 [Synechococcus sp. Ace-Pa]|nr:hypothetical protein FB106_1155 [Synechococcus sp. Ace-Pa]